MQNEIVMSIGLQVILQVVEDIYLALFLMNMISEKADNSNHEHVVFCFHRVDDDL